MKIGVGGEVDNGWEYDGFPREKLAKLAHRNKSLEF